MRQPDGCRYKKRVGPTVKKNEMRVAVAKDLLKCIKNGNITPITSYYCSLDETIVKRLEPSTQLQSLVPEIHCESCAIGSMFLAWVHLNNNITVEEFTGREGDYGPFSLNDDYTMREYLSKTFSGKQLSMIETAYMGGEFGQWGPVTLTITEREACHRFYKKYADKAKRLEAIMRNVIKNDGQFVLEQKKRAKC